MEVDEFNVNVERGHIVETTYEIRFPQGTVEWAGELVTGEIIDLGQPLLTPDCPMLDSGDTRILVMPPIVRGNRIIVRMFVGNGPPNP